MRPVQIRVATFATFAYSDALIDQDELQDNHATVPVSFISDKIAFDPLAATNTGNALGSSSTWPPLLPQGTMTADVWVCGWSSCSATQDCWTRWTCQNSTCFSPKGPNGEMSCGSRLTPPYCPVGNVVLNEVNKSRSCWRDLRSPATQWPIALRRVLNDQPAYSKKAAAFINGISIWSSKRFQDRFSAYSATALQV
jgi:hypothetical protein